MEKLSFSDYLPYFLGGIPITLQVAGLAMLLTVPVAFLLALGRMSGILVLRLAAGFVIEVFRGTSALVQLFWAYYVLPQFGIELTPMVAGVVVLGLNEASYFAEMVRPALQSVVKGQRDAAVSLHLPRFFVFWRITLPQALAVLWPPFGNVTVNMIKFTSLASLVTIQELTFRANSVRGGVIPQDETLVLFTTLMIYFAMSLIVIGILRYLGNFIYAWAGRSDLRVGRINSVPKWALGR